MIFESHAHYDDEAFDIDREELLNSMKENEIEYIINVGANIQSSKNTIELMNKYPFLYGALGVHPDEVAELDEDKMSWLKERCLLDKVVAVGEIGLDYYWNKSEADIQKDWFLRQLNLAKETNLPVIIHSRDAAQDTFDIMKQAHAHGIKGVIHCYAYSCDMARDYVEMGYYLGIGGVVTFKNAKKIKEVVECIPLEHILLETDSPYLAPAPHRGKRNSSLYIPYIAEEIARIKGIDYEEVIQVTNENARCLFSKVK